MTWEAVLGWEDPFPMYPMTFREKETFYKMRGVGRYYNNRGIRRGETTPFLINVPA